MYCSRVRTQRVTTFFQRFSPSTQAVSLIVLAVLVANAAYLLGLTNNDPITWTAGISHSLCHLSCGRSSIDPNVGALTQTLGHLAAVDLLHGHLPWWNSLEGLGTPLAGELQSAALFPFTLLLAAPAGLVVMHVLLEIIAGVSTYFLLRRLSVPMWFAAVGGTLFALDGTFAWLANTVVNPLAFLPMLLLGIEIILERASDSTRRGWYVAAVALALSLYSGFPEGAYFDAIFCGIWAIVRLFSLAPEIRARALRRLALAAGVGLVVALPTLVPFADFLKVAFVGGHTSALEGTAHLPAMAMPMLFNPYIYGTIFDNAKAAGAWDVIGGYFTVSVATLALIGLLGARLRVLRVTLAIWIVLGMAGSFNLLHTRVVWNIIPFVSNSAFSRYVITSCDMALIVLAVLGLVEISERRRSSRYFTGAAIVMTLVLVWGALAAETYNRGVPHHEKVRIFLLALSIIPFVVILALLVLSRLTTFAWSTALIAVVVVGESLVMFMVPTLQAPKQITIDYAPITFLQQHQGEERFLDFGVLSPNWGSQFGLNELSAIDLPFPTSFKNFIQENLYPGLKPANEFLVKGGSEDAQALEGQLTSHFRAYEDASVKYLLVPSSIALTPQLTALGVTPVFHDSLATIYQLPHPRPLFSTSSSCTVTSDGVDQATTNCSSSGATLLRGELSMSGWSATVNGQSAPISTVDGVYQRIALPQGTSVVDYRFVPPHEDLALLAAILAALVFMGSLAYEFRAVRRRGADDPSANNVE